MADPKLLRRCGVSEVTTPLWTLAEDAAAYAAAGFGAIGIWLLKLEQPRLTGGFSMPSKRIDPQVLDAAVEAVRASGLAVSHVVIAGDYTVGDSPDAMIEHSLHAVDVCAALGAECLIINPGRLNGRERDAAVEVVVGALAQVLERRRAPVRLALEPVIGWQSDLMNTLAQALDIADGVGHPDLGVFVDTWHLWETGTYDEDVARAGDRIFGFHLIDGHSGERHRAIPGEGEIPLAAMVRAAVDAGYAGSFDVEYTTPMAVGPSFDVPYDEVLRRCADGMTRVLADAGIE